MFSSKVVPPCLGLALAGALCTAPAAAQEGGIEVFAAETLFEGGTRLSLTHVYMRRGTLFAGGTDIADPLARTRQDQRLVVGVDHGVRPNLTLSALLPFVSKELDSNLGNVSSSGFGDVALLGKFRLSKKDWKRSSFNLSLVGGVETPTGTTDESQGGVRLPVPLQPGSGSWDPFAALTSNVSLNRFRFDALAFYKLNTEGTQDYQDGDFLALELDVSYRFLHTQYPGPTANVGVGLQWRGEGKDRKSGLTVPNTGADELLLRTGLTWHPLPNWDISLDFDVPVYQHYVGTQLGLDYRTFLAIGIRF